MATCDANSLLADGKCLNQLMPFQLQVIMAQLLCQISNAVSNPAAETLEWSLSGTLLAVDGTVNFAVPPGTLVHQCIVTADGANPLAVTIGIAPSGTKLSLSPGTTYTIPSVGQNVVFDLNQFSLTGKAGDKIWLLYI